MGTPKPLARSSAISDKEGTEDEEAMEIYTEFRKAANKGKWGMSDRKWKTLNINYILRRMEVLTLFSMCEFDVVRLWKRNRAIWSELLEA